MILPIIIGMKSFDIWPNAYHPHDDQLMHIRDYKEFGVNM
jgi:hypothetical protein